MRIISNFRDYYDSVMRTGMDKDVIYVRENLETEIDSVGIDFSTEKSYVSPLLMIGLVLLGYCGKIYKIYVVEFAEGKKTFYDYDSFKAFVLANSANQIYEFSERKWWKSKYQRFRDFDTKKLEHLFHKHQTPLFRIIHEPRFHDKDRTAIVLGPNLKELEFFKIKDSYTAYQDIFQYVSGILNKPESKMVKISDKDKVHKHGFDKWSFRQKGPKK